MNSDFRTKKFFDECILGLVCTYCLIFQKMITLKLGSHLREYNNPQE